MVWCRSSPDGVSMYVCFESNEDHITFHPFASVCCCAYCTKDEHLDWMPDGRELWEGVEQLHPTILTGLPMGTWAEPQKVEPHARAVFVSSVSGLCMC